MEGTLISHMDQLCTRCVLLVEDDELFHKAMAGFLSALGYQVITAVSAEEALEQAESGGIDLLLTDFQLPGMNGVALAHALRERGHDIPVILISGLPAERIAQEANGAGIEAVLRKPIQLATLENTLTELLAA